MQRATWTTKKKTINGERRQSIFETKVLRRLYGPICERGQWRKRYSTDIEELYNELSTVKVIKSGGMRWAGHVVRMGDNELPTDKPWRSTVMWPNEIKME